MEKGDRGQGEGGEEREKLQKLILEGLDPFLTMRWKYDHRVLGNLSPAFILEAFSSMFTFFIYSVTQSLSGCLVFLSSRKVLTCPNGSVKINFCLIERAWGNKLLIIEMWEQ